MFRSPARPSRRVVRRYLSSQEQHEFGARAQQSGDTLT
jgi:hypothetical protein